MKTIALAVAVLIAFAGCQPPPLQTRAEIRVGDRMEDVIATLTAWNATEYHFSRYVVRVPAIGDDARTADDWYDEYIINNPYAELPAYELPNGLVIDLRADGHILASVSHEIPGESKSEHRTVHGYNGVRYDGDWTLIGVPSEDG